MKEEYTLTAYTEDQLGLINKIAIMLLRKKISLKSLNISLCEIENMYRFTIVVYETFETVKNLTLQIEKIIDVFKCYCHNAQEIMSTQTVLYKVPTNILMNEESFDAVIQPFNIKYTAIEKEYTVFEASGKEKEIDNLTQALHKFGLVEFVKSAPISLFKSGNSFAKELA
ncbi:acetolactate synthase-1/3 small subunit [Flavobacterium sp. HSC-32F16]|uniref:acetolactate synthase small subunit n=1 Tax=Flavobacterium sp. HSC-32F16 TaxID=2910964 RepID=UPI0020A47A35|nr:acetolactate synthase small subunit [Flavobacterium sp. HSC-32F16]MCP2025309.1 acetolactate synthase-1/3 small subunit [Flavobacterium sp. HSC-32F16]